jgi:hypothetical protein
MPPEPVADLVAELSTAAATLGCSLHPRTAANLAVPGLLATAKPPQVPTIFSIVAD